MDEINLINQFQISIRLMYKTLTSSSSKQNFYPTHTDSAFIPVANKSAINFCLVSIAKKINRLQNHMSGEIEENATTIRELKQKINEEVEQWNASVQENAGNLQNFQSETIEYCKKKTMETSQTDRDITLNFQTKKIQTRTDLFKQAQRDRMLGHTKQIKILDKKLNHLSEMYSESKKNSEEQIYIMLGDCQSQIDTLEQQIGEYERKCSQNLNDLQDRIEDMDSGLGVQIQKQRALGKKDYQLVENLIEKLINKMTAL